MGPSMPLKNVYGQSYKVKINTFRTYLVYEGPLNALTNDEPCFVSKTDFR